MVALLVVVARLADEGQQRNLRLGAGYDFEVQLNGVFERQGNGIGEV